MDGRRILLCPPQFLQAPAIFLRIIFAICPLSSVRHCLPSGISGKTRQALECTVRRGILLQRQKEKQGKTIIISSHDRCVLDITDYVVKFGD